MSKIGWSLPIVASLSALLTIPLPDRAFTQEHLSREDAVINVMRHELPNRKIDCLSVMPERLTVIRIDKSKDNGYVERLLSHQRLPFFRNESPSRCEYGLYGALNDLQTRMITLQNRPAKWLFSIGVCEATRKICNYANIWFFASRPPGEDVLARAVSRFLSLEQKTTVVTAFDRDEPI